MIHYHGTPLTPKAELETMAGLCFCVPFVRPDAADWCLKNAQSIMWDNGAFSAHTRGIRIDWNRYYIYLADKLFAPHWAVIPDEIGGDEYDQKRLVRTWPFSKTNAAPVWHMHLPISYLDYLCDHWPKVCFGSSAQFWQVGSPSWRARADQAWNMIAKKNHTTWVHMLRGLALSGDVYPFASADSVNVARNFKRNKVQANIMARKIDAIQPQFSAFGRKP